MDSTYPYPHMNFLSSEEHETLAVASSQAWAGCPERSSGCLMRQWVTATALRDRQCQHVSLKLLQGSACGRVCDEWPCSNDRTWLPSKLDNQRMLGEMRLR